MSNSQIKKSIVITGGAAGIGLATARKLSASGWFVGLIDLNEENLEQAKKHFPTGRIATAVADVSCQESFGRALEHIIGKSGGINAIFNNAGVLNDGEFSDLALEKHNQTVSVNVLGVINGCYLAKPHLQDQPGIKHVINMSSASTTYGIPGLSTYSATKIFVEHLSEALDVEWGEDEIKVTTIAVPFVQTAMLKGDSEALEEYVERQKKLVQPKDVADRVERILTSPVSGPVHEVMTGSLKAQKLLRRMLPNLAMRKIMQRSFTKAQTEAALEGK
ncbi:SDR family NAD(P)-dependent oxidoreductase [Sphingorhabdus sp. Alg231-15]|uniref:SDR family NAD(P)-dependent oxidoreductase n=1 Tax=Sphingorhabdus sp. Alg231-15 TaxID=1922222 RepID=UPI000D55DE15